MDLSTVPEKFRDDVRQAVTTLLEYGARDVYLFGSLTTNTWRENSDIDLAIAGMEPRLFFKAYALASRKLVHELDLVDLDHEEAMARFLMETQGLVKIA